MSMTFDEAMAKVGTYLQNNDLSNPDDNDKFFYIILNGLQNQYAPTIEMTRTQYNFLVGSDGLVDIIGNITVDGIVKEYFDDGFWYPLNERDVANAFLHPETVKVVK
ncbi:hypothetical protein BI065_gp23 [Weissella phage WCP30]|uniref:hypothetical protein n=1 Tax=Weissella phage WCP30 TaxID=1837862 RepID=UPI00081111D2|nr:hypothetical protein BI065_gp23 [Weissella phage WCP30]ANU78896.1 hypothetical protein [Weissella phage WCP30]